MGKTLLACTLYADVAPLPIPLADHLFHYWRSSSFAEEDFLLEIIEKRHAVYRYMDSFVRFQNHDQPRHLRYTTLWLREALGRYTPSQRPGPVSPKTFNDWVSQGFVRNTTKGHPTPDSGAALLIVRMMMARKRLLFSRGLDQDETWWCYAQDAPDCDPYMLPVNKIHQLPAKTLLWTPWAGASWQEQWMLLSNAPGQEYYGAIRFAGVQTIHGQLMYTLSLPDLLAWNPNVACIVEQGEFQVNEHQALARLVLVHLARTRVPYL
jgi:hypothetical protein